MKNHALFRDLILFPVLRELGQHDQRLDTAEAAVLLAAIAYQESNLEHRRQRPSGPARGLWQFEVTGAEEALVNGHWAFNGFLADMGYNHVTKAADLHALVEHSDLVACAAARALLWPDKAPLPAVDDVQGAYAYYDRRWRPGKKRPEAWPWSYERARRLCLTNLDPKPNPYMVMLGHEFVTNLDIEPE